MAAKEASHLRNEVPMTTPPNVAAWLMSFLAAIFNSFKSECSKAAVSSSSGVVKVA